MLNWFKKLGIRNKLLLTYASIVLIGAVALVMNIRGTSELGAAVQTSTDQVTVETALVHELREFQTAMSKADAAGKDHLLTGDPSYLDIRDEFERKAKQHLEEALEFADVHVRPNIQAMMLEIESDDAEHAVALEQGTTMLDDEVTRVQASGGQVEIGTRQGDTIHANRVLIATGAFTNVNRLLPRRLDVAVRAAMVMLAEVSRDVEYDWPSILYAKTDGAETFWGLLMPPVLYPDGRRYVKTMDDHYGSRPLVSQDEIRDWYRGDGHTEHHHVLRRALGEIAPELSILDTRLVPCLITDTATHYPYIDMASERIGIVVGGNGKGAKSSDEIGRLGAEMIRTGEWSSSLPESLFAAQYVNGSNEDH